MKKKPILDENSDISNINFNKNSLYDNNTLTEGFIEKYKDKVDWICVWILCSVSESFIEKHKDKVYWPYIARFQKLSNTFISKYIDKLDINIIKANEYIDQEFIEKLQLLR